MLEHLLNGFSFEVKIKLWKKIFEVLLPLIGMKNEDDLHRFMNKYFPILLPLILFSAGEIDAQLNITQEHIFKLAAIG